jgi:digeranylgeranylglycerophospholipid reductase
MVGNMLKCDVLVIGAGPAGLSASFSAANTGANVICIDRKNKIGEPVKCAEAIGHYLFSRLPFKIPEKLLEWKIEGIDFFYRNIKIRKNGPNWQGYSINRTKFENWLFNRTLKTGAKVNLSSDLDNIVFEKPYSRAIIKTSDSNAENEILCKKIIAADGLESKVSSLLKQPKLKKFDYIEVYSWELGSLKLKDAHYERFYFDDFAPDCFFYIFPKSESVANVGIGGFCSEVKLKYYFRQFLESSFLKNEIQGCDFIAEKSKKAPFDISRSLSIGNVAFVGDSANQNIKPFIEGILPSVICGEIVGSIILNKNFSENNYRNKVNEKLPHIFESGKLTPCLKKIFTLDDERKYFLLMGLISEIIRHKKFDEHLELSEAELVKKLSNSK